HCRTARPLGAGGRAGKDVPPIFCLPGTGDKHGVISGSVEAGGRRGLRSEKSNLALIPLSSTEGNSLLIGEQEYHANTYSPRSARRCGARGEGGSRLGGSRVFRSGDLDRDARLVGGTGAESGAGLHES